jgi:hypothetical protein
MARQVEAAQAWIEQVANPAFCCSLLTRWRCDACLCCAQLAYQMNEQVPLKVLGPLIALCKIQCTETLEFCAREASHVSAAVSCVFAWRVV